jgi:hypothetical protein
MAGEENDRLRENFLKVYSNLPLNTREETILVQEGENDKRIKEPVSWQVVYFEVKNNTLKGEHFLSLLHKIGLI